jgi:methylated-DNA-[protein]-cysteine S-methyltransferase
MMNMQNAHDARGDVASQTVDLGALGVVTVAASERAVVAITFGVRDLGERAGREGRPERARAGAREQLLARAARELKEYAAGARTRFSCPFAAAGTPFQREVWGALATIPFGETCSYTELARAIGRPRAVRAVGAANANNPLLIVVPCHRVLASTGELTGYAGGLPRKAWLLAHERARRVAAQAAG